MRKMCLHRGVCFKLTPRARKLVFFSSVALLYILCRQNPGAEEEETPPNSTPQIRHLTETCRAIKAEIETGSIWSKEYAQFSPYDLEALYSPPDISLLQLNHQHRFSVCVPYKAGSQSWRYLVSSTDETADSNQITIAQLQHFTKVIQVREPLERLLSAYRFTFEASNSHLGRSLRNIILDKFPINPPMKDAKGQEMPSFSQFLDFLVTGYTERGMAKDLYTTGAALHWLPQFVQCNPCSQEFLPDHLLYLDHNWVDNAKPILESVGISSNRTFYLVNPTHGGHSSELHRLRQYYSQISETRLLQLYEMYKPDFLLFNFDFYNLVKMLKDDNNK